MLGPILIGIMLAKLISDILVDIEKGGNLVAVTVTHTPFSLITVDVHPYSGSISFRDNELAVASFGKVTSRAMYITPGSSVNNFDMLLRFAVDHPVFFDTMIAEVRRISSTKHVVVDKSRIPQYVKEEEKQ